MKSTHKPATIGQYWPVLLLLAAAVILLVLIIVRATGTNKSDTSAAVSMVREEYNPRVEDPDSNFELIVDDHKIVSGPSRIVVKQNASVGVKIESKSGQIDLELDGYAISSESDPDGPGGFKFIATTKGSYDFYVLDSKAADRTNAERIKLGTIVVE